MKKVSLCVVVFFSFTFFLAAQDSLNQNTGTENIETEANQNQNQNENSHEMSSSTASAEDIEFVTKAASSSMLEVELGKLAQHKGTSEAVKEFGKLMVQEHTKANRDLKRAAGQNNIEVPTTLTDEHLQIYSELNALSGAEFDEKYIETMVESHEEAISMFEDASEDLSSNEIKSFAENKLPILKKHHERVRSISETVARGN